MKTENKVLMDQARVALKDKWTAAVLVMFLYFIVLNLDVLILEITNFSPSSEILISVLIMALIVGPLVLGMNAFYLSLSRGREVKVLHIFNGFNHFVKAVAVYLLIMLFSILWLLLLIIPGIIAAMSYSMTFFILADDNSISPMDAIDRSKKMMYGYKMKYFLLYFRFFGWALLCILTLGIGFLWLIPYMVVTSAKFYDDIKDQDIPVSAVEKVMEQKI